MRKVVLACNVLLFSAALVAFLTGCSKPSAATMDASTPAVDPSQSSSELTIVPNETLRKQLRIGSPQTVSIGEDVTVAARVDVDATRIARVGSPVKGRINSLLAHEGQYVGQGQTLALVSTTDLSDAQLSLLKALTRKSVAQRAVERARILLKSEVIGAAELQRRQAELDEAELDRDAARDQLNLLGMPPEAIEELEKHRKMNSTARIVASMRGLILSRQITVGQVVQPADSAFEIADLSALWLVADVPSPDAAALFIGQHVEADIDTYRGHTVHGKLSFVSSTVNEATRTVRVHMELPNPRGTFKPAMLATMKLRGHAQHRTCIPATAVIREENGNHLFVKSAGDVFTLRPVELGPEQGEWVVLLGGVHAGDQIVLDGAFHLNNERRRRNQRGSGGD